MKKFLTLILIAVAMASCGDSSSSYDDGGDNKGGTTTQLGKTNTPIAQSEWKGKSDPNTTPLSIAGNWVLYKENNSEATRFLAFQFSNTQWGSLKTKPKTGYSPIFSDFRQIEYNDTQIRDLTTGIIYNYKLSSGLKAISLFDGSNTCLFKILEDNGGGDDINIIATPEMGKPTNPIPADKWLGDWNDKNNLNYKGRAYNPLEGSWILTKINGKNTDQFVVYKLDEDISIYIATKKPVANKLPEFNSGMTKYTLNGSQMKDSRGYIYDYKINTDRNSLTLFDGANAYAFIPYDYNGLWYWKGDWNNPNSFYYSIYDGKYNPIEGDWTVLGSYDGGANYRFTNDYQVIPLGYSGYKYIRKYEINDTGVYEYGYAHVSSLYYKYKFSSNKDTLYYGNPNPERLKVMIRKEKW